MTRFDLPSPSQSAATSQISTSLASRVRPHLAPPVRCPCLACLTHRPYKQKMERTEFQMHTFAGGEFHLFSGAPAPAGTGVKQKRREQEGNTVTRKLIFIYPVFPLMFSRPQKCACSATSPLVCRNSDKRVTIGAIKPRAICCCVASHTNEMRHPQWGLWGRVV